MTRHANDFYKTPASLVKALAIHLPPYLGHVLDPACGDGVFDQQLRRRDNVRTWVNLDICPQENVSMFTVGDFLTVTFATRMFDTIITNPPFSLMTQFIKKGLSLEPRRLIYLARLSILGSQERYRELWTQVPAPSSLIVMPKRPSFTGGGSDNSEYAWFCWGEMPQLGLSWMDPTTY